MLFRFISLAPEEQNVQEMSALMEFYKRRGRHFVNSVRESRHQISVFARPFIKNSMVIFYLVYETHYYLLDTLCVKNCGSLFCSVGAQFQRFLQCASVKVLISINIYFQNLQSPNYFRGYWRTLIVELSSRHY